MKNARIPAAPAKNCVHVTCVKILLTPEIMADIPRE